ncbi:hypothetical protein RRG08_019617 [Elysia crispata]|uniref:Uncharacterized protein n=1 Tax=Elysia crispata TaxID=231223 RepID=A0AAE1E750_9GAST|nr:hypothetical protein RRG08_019617 [Elysia crispata]
MPLLKPRSVAVQPQCSASLLRLSSTLTAADPLFCHLRSRSSRHHKVLWHSKGSSQDLTRHHDQLYKDRTSESLTVVYKEWDREF